MRKLQRREGFLPPPGANGACNTHSQPKTARAWQSYFEACYTTYNLTCIFRDTTRKTRSSVALLKGSEKLQRPPELWITSAKPHLYGMSLHFLAMSYPVLQFDNHPSHCHDGSCTNKPQPMKKWSKQTQGEVVGSTTTVYQKWEKNDLVWKLLHQPVFH